ncbi:hypothetical protein JYK00_05625 [Thermosipho ferrireducens]|uniref:Uncharacterized protein n=1 Tax=Thermosipho ferrireducens TaxID=2571116 RepID=A0ABX7S666_9BACT|nr:hypothetical protein [Thermosipho ferrireducens]QTA37225.1 hypothetical protein JYK00_05625 [Thermosipho ferrireducens]
MKAFYLPLIALGVFMGIFGLYHYFVARPEGLVLEFDKDVPSYFLFDKPSIVTYHAVFTEKDYDTLVIPKVSGNILKIYLNDFLIYEIGTETSNIWNRVLLVKVDRKMFKENNHLKVEIYGTYDAGIHQDLFFYRL